MEAGRFAFLGAAGPPSCAWASGGETPRCALRLLRRSLEPPGPPPPAPSRVARRPQLSSPPHLSRLCPIRGSRAPPVVCLVSLSRPVRCPAPLRACRRSPGGVAASVGARGRSPRPTSAPPCGVPPRRACPSARRVPAGGRRRGRPRACRALPRGEGGGVGGGGCRASFRFPDHPPPHPPSPWPRAGVACTRAAPRRAPGAPVPAPGHAPPAGSPRGARVRVWGVRTPAPPAPLRSARGRAGVCVSVPRRSVSRPRGRVAVGRRSRAPCAPVALRPLPSRRPPPPVARSRSARPGRKEGGRWWWWWWWGRDGVEEREEGEESGGEGEGKTSSRFPLPRQGLPGSAALLPPPSSLPFT